jgi:hypothetical protein
MATEARLLFKKRKTGLLVLSQSILDSLKQHKVGFNFKEGPLMDTCFSLVEQLIDEIYENRSDLTPEMKEILTICIQSEEIDKACKDALWFFTDLIIGAWVGPALT